MSLTSYRAAPPRVTKCLCCAETQKGPFLFPGRPFVLWAAGFGRQSFDMRMGFYPFYPPAVMPGDDLLFQRLSVSTIGADRFHGRVRDGIGWVTDAMVTKQ